ncbi:MAG: hypothetical protein JWP97_1137 [Labilithrix sp.]|nr:hypothetical protein [Labilithrix sp.]
MSAVRVVFLDFDGVLNRRAFVEASGAPHTPGPHLLDPEAVARLERLCVETGASIVITSSWRTAFDAASLTRLLRDKGLARAKVLGVTPLIPYKRGRGQEVQAWLDSPEGREVEAFVVLDDVADLLHLAPRLVQTSFETGLTDEHVALARVVLCAG